jgi:hypothetical protein
MGSRKTQLADCNPRWRTYDGKDDHSPDALEFDCPEGHEHCRHVVPFTPALDGSRRPVLQRNGAQWERTNDVFATLTLTPSIRITPSKRMLPDGRIDEIGCAFHGFIKSGQIEFCGDSR